MQGLQKSSASLASNKTKENPGSNLRNTLERETCVQKEDRSWERFFPNMTSYQSDCSANVKFLSTYHFNQSPTKMRVLLAILLVFLAADSLVNGEFFESVADPSGFLPAAVREEYENVLATRQPSGPCQQALVCQPEGSDCMVVPDTGACYNCTSGVEACADAGNNACDCWEIVTKFLRQTVTYVSFRLWIALPNCP